MTEPDLTDHGRLIERAREDRLLITRREAARRAGISESRWRQVVTGVHTAGGQQLPVNPSPRTLIAMALAVEVDPWEVVQVAKLAKPPTEEAVRRLAYEIGQTNDSTAQQRTPNSDGAPPDAPDEVIELILRDERLSQEMKGKIIRLIHERRARQKAAELAETRSFIEAFRDAG